MICRACSTKCSTILLAGILLTLFAGAGAAPLAQSRAGTSDQEALIELERRWNEAFYAKDVGFLETILADDFMATYDDGSRGDRTRELRLTEEFNQQVTSADQHDFKVRVYGDTALVSFTLTLVGPRRGVPTTVIFSYVDVFIWRDGRWQCVSSQSTKVADAQ
jgi:ketosteroid isomerase-like protein